MRDPHIPQRSAWLIQSTCLYLSVKSVGTCVLSSRSSKKLVSFQPLQRCRSSVLFDQCTMTIHDVQKPNVPTLPVFRNHHIASGINSITRSLKLPRAQSAVLTTTMTYKYFKCFWNDAGKCVQLYMYVWTKLSFYNTSI